MLSTPLDAARRRRQNVRFQAHRQGAFAPARPRAASVRATEPTPVRLLIGSFALLILAGTVLLLLPFATPTGQPIGPVDALFTATSAVCVTGLVVRDTGSGFTLFGQGVILALIQLGGLGVMTFSLLIFSLLRGRLSMTSRLILTQTLAGTGLWEDFWPLLRLVFRFTVISEALGALLLFGRWQGELGTGKAAWGAAFHSISAFCNAGFSTFPDGLVSYRGDLVVNVVVSALIIVGGLGYITLFELQRRRARRTRLSVHTKIALTVSAALLLTGAAAIWIVERRDAFAGMGLGEQALASWFQSVTARTAGFNTVNIGSLAPVTLFVVILLMFVGGSPGSCAGGIKTTTFGVLVLVAWNRLRVRSNVNAFGRTLDRLTIENAVTISITGAVVVVVGLFAVLFVESPDAAAIGQGAFLRYLFEVVSALGTVGLSTGITEQLLPATRVVVALLMFLGRLGPLSVAGAVAKEDTTRDVRYAEEGVMVG